MAPSLRRRGPLGVLIAVTALLAAACNGNTQSGDVKLGFITALTGPVAFAGQTFAHGTELAVDQLNQEGYLGGGRKIELVKKEGAETPARAVEQAKQLAGDQSVVGTICCILSPTAGAVKPITTAAKMPLDIYGATDLGLEKPPYVVRTTTMPQDANKSLAQKVAQQSHPASVAYAVTQDNSGWVSQLKSFQEGFAGTGVRDLGTVNTLAAQTDFSGAAGQLMAKNPAAVVVACLQQSSISLIKALRSRGYNGLIVASEAIGSPGAYKAAGGALADIPFPVYFFAGKADAQGQKFAQAYKAKYGTDPDDYAAQGYIAAYTMATAIKNAGKDVTRASVTKALSSLKRMDGTIYGTVGFQNGQLHAPESIVHITWTKDGRQTEWTPSGAGKS
ncbi:ABC transporter substrate-binding protein [Actinoallomurus sp. NBC_01490]|uniref:ABC transporter substrate-binding protein n=1 Tax=Actinoallomurus sp. NBC_01490 TaxID=2903557 RepID=UPI002E379856|nr:ABC transporter substrate-binding protein [Actinoallomurus sp. NBC_01490]